MRASEDGNATLEAQTPIWHHFDRSRRLDARLVAINDRDTALGWAAASAVSSRAIYREVVEHSGYVATDSQGRVVGRELLEAMFDAVENVGCCIVQASIFG